jgi:hypothetical protein
MISHGQAILDAIYSCGTITRSSILKSGNTDEIIKDLIEEKIIKKQAVEINEKKIAVYTFTKFGERFYTEQTGKTLFFRCPSIEKAVALSYIYSNLTKDEQTTWKSKDVWLHEEEETIVPDATYMQKNILNGVCIMNKSEQDDIKKKKELANFKGKYNIKKFAIKYY